MINNRKRNEMKTPIYSLRLPTDLRKQLDALARKQDRPVAYIVLALLRRALAVQ